jgi:hypothetical protein
LTLLNSSKSTRNPNKAANALITEGFGAADM